MFVSVVIARGIIAEVQRQGLNADALLAEINLDNASLADLRVRITAQQLDRLVTGAMALTNDPGFGLSLGVRAPDTMLQLVGHLLMSCDTLRAAIEVFQRCSSLLVDDLRMNVVETGNEVRLSFAFHTAVAPHSARFGAENMLAIGHRIAQRFVPKAHALEILFQHSPPGYEARYEQLWGVRPRFNQELNGVVYPRDILDVRQPYSDDTMRSVLAETAERFVVEQQSRITLADRVRTLLRYERDLCNVDANRVAREVGLTHRALRRRLAAEGSSVTLLVEEARCRVACEELRRPNSCIKETAERLGYSEPSAFHRAFKRWTGQTPAQYSRAVQHVSP
jgi:AraC-like DNA-binding protein